MLARLAIIGMLARIFEEEERPGFVHALRPSPLIRDALAAILVRPIPTTRIRLAERPPPTSLPAEADKGAWPDDTRQNFPMTFVSAAGNLCSDGCDRDRGSRIPVS